MELTQGIFDEVLRLVLVELGTVYSLLVKAKAYCNLYTLFILVLL